MAPDNDTVLDGLISVLSVVRAMLDERENFIAAAYVEQALNYLKRDPAGVQVQIAQTSSQIS